MDKKTKNKLAAAMQSYLQLKELTSTQEVQMGELKEVILAIAHANPNDFTDGELLLEGVGLLKYISNPAKVVFVQSGKTLNEIETMGLVTELGEKFAKRTINMARLKTAINVQDRDVMAVLLNYGVEFIQGQRLDVKPA